MGGVEVEMSLSEDIVSSESTSADDFREEMSCACAAEAPTRRDQAWTVKVLNMGGRT